jgi:hypothetical protein
MQGPNGRGGVDVLFCVGQDKWGIVWGVSSIWWRVVLWLDLKVMSVGKSDM